VRIAIVAGEPSGDQLAEGLVQKLKAHYPDAIIEGIAGEKMQVAGCKTLFPLETLSVMGVVEVIKNLPAILKIRRGILKHFKANRPDIYIGVDAPDFNLPVEKKLRPLGVKTVHYVSPSVWAWREGRMKTIKKATDVVLAILPFEEAFYQKHNHRAVFVGHPLANKISIEPNTLQAKQKLQLDENKISVALLPGSRAQEVERLLKPFLGAALICQEKLDRPLQFVIPVAKPSLSVEIEKYQDIISQLDVKVIAGNAHTVLEAADYVMLASGTAALEAMLYKKPMVMAYKFGKINYLIAKTFIKIKRFSLPNILADDDVILELIQDNATAETLSDELICLMTNSEAREKMVSKFYELHEMLRCDSDEKAFQVVKDLIEAQK